MPGSDRSTHWMGVLEAQKSSGVSIKRWCDSNNVNVHTFQSWRYKLNGAAPASSAKAIDWTQVSVPAKPISRARKSGAAAPPSAPNGASASGHVARSSSHIFVHVGQCFVEVTAGFDPAVLTDVLSVLEARC